MKLDRSRPSTLIDHAAVALGVSRRTIYNMINDGRLEAGKTHLGQSTRVYTDTTFYVDSASYQNHGMAK